ncbi:MAG: DsbE family thiol:disulfide interchange protein [Alphaproteobacteria bacterium]|nr:DsbE family thiol:disulfide interchange protein [Alphaproteobacteria bacterium]
MRLRYVVPALVFAVLAAVFALYLHQVGSGGKNIAEVPSVFIERAAPPLALPPIEGMTGGLASADLGGRAVLVNVFASWCPPCRAEHPLLMRLAREGVLVYGINVKDKPADAKAFLAELGNPFARIGADRQGRAAIDWGVYGYPETFVVDRDSRIRYRHVGAITERDLETVIRPLLARLAR